MKWFTTFWALLLGLLFSTSAVQAQTNLSNYELILDIPKQQVNEPKIAELSLPLSSGNSASYFFVDSSSSKQAFQIQQATVGATPFTITPSSGLGTALTDKQNATYVEYPFVSGQSNEGSLTYTFQNATELSGIRLRFADFSRSPDEIKIEVADSVEGNTTILDKTAYTSPNVRFPKKLVKNLIVTLYYSQPIRLYEASVIEEGTTAATDTLIRFVIEPNESYSLYYSPDRTFNTYVPEYMNFFSEKKPLKLINVGSFKPNPSYIPSDTDNDQIPDNKDNCVSVPNSDQKDTNVNNVGDVCDDTDYDGVINNIDNCLIEPNNDQRDIDGDGIGDICDSQESRFTEQYPWLPWAAMGGVTAVIAALVIMMVRGKSFEELNASEAVPPPVIK